MSAEPRVYTIPDVLRILKISRRTFDRNRRRMSFLQELRPRIGRPRYRADLVDQYARGEWKGTPIVLSLDRERRRVG